MSSNREIFNVFKTEFPYVVFFAHTAEIGAWLDKHMSGRYIITVTALTPELIVAATFKEKSDATLFKLTWC